MTSTSDRVLIEQLAIQNELVDCSLFGESIRNIHNIPPWKVHTILDRLEFVYRSDYLDIVRNLHKPKQFRAYRIGIPSSGSTTIFRLFGNYSRKFEFYVHGKGEMTERLEQKKITAEQFKDFIITLEYLSGCEMDSSYDTHSYIGLLSEEFRDAKFIFTIRDCYSWLSDLVDWLIDTPNFGMASSAFGLSLDVPLTRRLFFLHYHQFCDDLIRFWATTNTRILEQLPKERSLLIRTNQILDSVDQIASFLGIPTSTLDTKTARRFVDYPTVNIYESLDLGYLEERFDAHCGKLVEIFFSGYRLSDYLEEPSCSVS